MAANFNIYDLKNFTFKKFPTALYSEPKYYDLSDSAKILYAYAYDKMGLSLQNGYIDDAGDVYIYYTLQSIIEEFHWSREKAKRALKALEEFDLIEQKREGAGLSYRIYVKKLITSEESINNKASEGVGSKRAQGGLETSPGVGSKRAPNKTNNINNNNYNTSILSNHEVYVAPNKDTIDLIKESSTVNKIKSQINYDALMVDYDNNPIIGEIVELIADIYTSDQPGYFINKTIRAKKDVIRRFMKIDYVTMAYILDNLQVCDSEIKNIRSYLLTTLYNAPITLGAYYLTKVNADMKKLALERVGDSS